MLPVIANDAGMDVDATAETMATFVFPDVATQLSEAWLGGAAPSFMKGVADVFVESGSIPGALDSYAGTINTGPLAAANDM
jgi:taurine transport system substrate-binding protein